MGRDLTNRRVWVRVSRQSNHRFGSASTHVFTGNAVDDIVGRSTEELGDNGELVDVVLAGEQRLALQHLGENASRTPDVDLNVVLLPCEHDLGSAVISRRDVASHLGVLNTGETEVANLQVAVLVDENVAGLQITVDYTSRVDVFQAAL